MGGESAAEVAFKFNVLKKLSFMTALFVFVQSILLKVVEPTLLISIKKASAKMQRLLIDFLYCTEGGNRTRTPVEGTGF